MAIHWVLIIVVCRNPAYSYGCAGSRWAGGIPPRRLRRSLLFKWAPMNGVEGNPAVHGAAVMPVAVAPTTACASVEAWRKQGRLTISRSAGGVLRPSLGLQARE